MDQYTNTFLSLPHYKKIPLISLGWFSGETSAYSRSLDHDHL